MTETDWDWYRAADWMWCHLKSQGWKPCDRDMSRTWQDRDTTVTWPGLWPWAGHDRDQDMTKTWTGYCGIMTGTWPGHDRHMPDTWSEHSWNMDVTVQGIWLCSEPWVCHYHMCADFATAGSWSVRTLRTSPTKSSALIPGFPVFFDFWSESCSIVEQPHSPFVDYMMWCCVPHVGVHLWPKVFFPVFSSLQVSYELGEKLTSCSETWLTLSQWRLGWVVGWSIRSTWEEGTNRSWFIVMFCGFLCFLLLTAGVPCLQTRCFLALELAQEQPIRHQDHLIRAGSLSLKKHIFQKCTSACRRSDILSSYRYIVSVDLDS